jgi:hypothetical protein
MAETTTDPAQRVLQCSPHARAACPKRGRAAAGLFDPVELAEAEHWISGENARELGYSDDLPRFLAASRSALEAAQLALAKREREQQAAQEERAMFLRLAEVAHRKRRAALAAAGASLVLVAVAGIALIMIRNAQQAGELAPALGAAAEVEHEVGELVPALGATAG